MPISPNLLVCQRQRCLAPAERFFRSEQFSASTPLVFYYRVCLHCVDRFTSSPIESLPLIEISFDEYLVYFVLSA
jgi:hypothetical protein